MLPRRIPGAIGGRPARRFVAASSQYLTASTTLGLGAADPFCVALWASRDAATAHFLFAIGVNGSNANRRYLHTPGTTNIAVRSVDSANAGSSATSAANAYVTAGGFYPIVASWDSDALRRLILNGVETTETTTRTVGSVPTVLRVGSAQTPGSYMEGNIPFLAVYAGGATDSMISRIMRGDHPLSCPHGILECWQLDRVGPISGLVRGTILSPTNDGALTVGPPNVQGPPRRVWLPVGSAGSGPTAYSLTVDAGSYAVTGSDAGLYAHRVLTADAGSYALTGSDASVLHSRVLAADAGAYSITGADASFLRAYVLTAEVGAYAVDGVAADLVRVGALEMTAEPGVYALTGADAVLRLHRVLTADPGSYAVTGSDASFLRAYVLTADAGAYVLTGSAATTAYSGNTIPQVILLSGPVTARQPGAGTLTARRIAAGTVTKRGQS